MVIKGQHRGPYDVGTVQVSCLWWWIHEHSQMNGFFLEKRVLSERKLNEERMF